MATADRLTDLIKIMKGVLQGETVSPSILNVYFGGIVEKLNSTYEAGIRLGEIVVHILLFADDMCIVALSAETLQLKLNVASKFLKQQGVR